MPKGIYQHKKGYKRPRSPEWQAKITASLKGMTAWNKGKKVWWTEEKSAQWKGDKVSYSGLHKWVTKQLGSPKRCDNPFCVEKNIKRYEWANVNHEYKRNLTDWLRLCVKCHRKYDLGIIKIHG